MKTHLVYCGWDYILLDYFLEFMKFLTQDDKKLLFIVKVSQNVLILGHYLRPALRK